MAADERWFTVAAEMLVTVPGEDRPIGRLRPGQSYRALSFDDDWVWVPGPGGAVGVVPLSGVTFSHAGEAGPASEPVEATSGAAVSESDGVSTGATVSAVTGPLLVLGGVLIAAGAYRPWAYWDDPGLWGDLSLVFAAGLIVAAVGVGSARSRSGSFLLLAWIAVAVVVVIAARFAVRERWYFMDFRDGFWLALAGIVASLIALVLSRFGRR